MTTPLWDLSDTCERRVKGERCKRPLTHEGRCAPADEVRWGGTVDEDWAERAPVVSVGEEPDDAEWDEYAAGMAEDNREHMLALLDEIEP